jgi:predicted metalloprotease
MRLDDLPRSDRVEDRRGRGGPGGGFGIPTGRRGGIGLGTIVILLLLAWALGINPLALLGGGDIFSGPRGGSQQQSQPAPAPTQTGQGTDQMGEFVSAVLGSTEAQWQEIFAKAGKTYRPPSLVMFSGGTRSACGVAQSAMGPFYCPIDQKVYLDTAFFRDLERRFRACDVGSKTCQFSQAYVIAHEIGHHEQNQLGILPQVQQAQQGMPQVDANDLQVRVELQADCFAGVWAHHAQKRWQFIEPGDVEAALQTASAIGDDTLQRRTQGYVVPDGFTHGSSEQRTRWFMTGLKSGSVQSCNTYDVPQP